MPGWHCHIHNAAIGEATRRRRVNSREECDGGIAATAFCCAFTGETKIVTARLAVPARSRKALRMNTLAPCIRQARAEDAADVAQVYIDSWHDTYPGVLPTALLQAMTPKGQTARWLATIQAQGRETVLVADTDKHGIVGMTSLGPARDRELGFDGEIYTLYVDPAHFAQGVGRALLEGAFAAMRANGMASCVIWAHARNHARFFYEAMGGRLIAERTAQMMGEPCPEAAFGWKTLALAERSPAR